MAGMTDDLKEILKDQNTIYKELLGLAADKKECLIKSDVDSLRTITEKEGILMTRLSKKEKIRQDLIKNIGVVLNKKDVNISMLIDTLEGNDKIIFEELKDEMVKALSELKKVNDQNSMLVAEGLKLTEISLNLLVGPDQSDNSYGNELKEVGTSKGQRHFDTQR